MPWLPINNGDGGNFESDPGSNVYNASGWDLEQKFGTSPSRPPFLVGRIDEVAHKDQYSAGAIIAPSNIEFLPNTAEAIGGFKFTANGSKTYAIRLFIACSFPNLPFEERDKVFINLKEDENSIANGVQLSSDLKYYSFIGDKRFNEFRRYQRAAFDGRLQFSVWLNAFKTSIADRDNKLLNGFLAVDQIEYFEHEPLTSSVATTAMSYRNANDAVSTVSRTGGSGSFTLLIEKNEGGSFIFYSQQSVVEADNILNLATNNMEPGTYRYTLTDNELDYKTTEEFTIANPASTLDLIVTKNNVSSAGLTDGSIALSATGDSGNYTFDISPKVGTEVSTLERTNLPAGSYTCKVTDTGSGESITETVTINDAASNLTLALTKQDVTIPGLSNGQINASAFGDTGEYAFSISPQTGQQENNIFTGLAAGTYNITVEDLNSLAKVTQSITIVEPGELAISITDQTNNLCFESSQGAVSISVSGGTGPYSYLWNDGPTTLNRTGLSTGNHLLRITDSLGYSKVFTITITSPPRIVINISKTGQEVGVNVSGGVFPYYILWSDGSTETQRTLAIGSYIVQVTDANGCSKSTTVEITDFKFYFSKNPVWLERLTDPTAKANLSWDAVVKIEKDYNTGTFETLFTANHPAREDGSTIFEFSEILKGQLQLDLPEHKGKLPYVMEGNFKRFYVESNEKYGEPPVAQTAVTTETFHIIRGGLSREEYASEEFFSVFLDNQKTPFFSWEAIAKNVYPDQPEYLAYPLVNIGISQLKLKVEAFDIENNLLFTKQTEFINGVQPYMLINFPVGFIQMGFNNIAGNQDISYYTVEAVNQNDIAISEKKYYYLNWKTQNSRQYFIYENALGVWATLVAEGNRSGSLEVEMEMLKSPVQFNYNASQRTEKAENKVLKQMYNYAAGNIIEEEAFILADFVRSQNVYEFTAKRWRPVSIEMGGDWFNTFEDSTPFEFSVMYEKDKNWTPDVYRVDNRKIIIVDEIEEVPNTLLPLLDYDFESSYDEWALSSVNDDRITRSSSESYKGSASAKFSMSNYSRIKNENGDNLLRGSSFVTNKVGDVMAFDITDKIIDGSKNKVEMFVKTQGKDFTGSLGTTSLGLIPYITYKAVGRNYYAPLGNQSGYIELNQNALGFTNIWQNANTQSASVIDKNSVQEGYDVLEVEKWAVFFIARITSNDFNFSNDMLNNLPIYFDDVKVTAV